MILGHAAGTASVMALAEGAAVQDIDVPELRGLLLKQKQKLTP
jgi:hypothetical protein